MVLVLVLRVVETRFLPLTKTGLNIGRIRYNGRSYRTPTRDTNTIALLVLGSLRRRMASVVIALYYRRGRKVIANNLSLSFVSILYIVAVYIDILKPSGNIYL